MNQRALAVRHSSETHATRNASPMKVWCHYCSVPSPRHIVQHDMLRISLSDKELQLFAGRLQRAHSSLQWAYSSLQWAYSSLEGILIVLHLWCLLAARYVYVRHFDGAVPSIPRSYR